MLSNLIAGLFAAYLTTNPGTSLAQNFVPEPIQHQKPLAPEAPREQPKHYGDLLSFTPRRRNIYGMPTWNARR